MPVKSVVATRLMTSASNVSPGAAATITAVKIPVSTNTTAAAGISTDASST
jgi:hypothetical protein